MLFLIGSLWFWVLLLIELAFLIWLVEEEYSGFAAFSLAIFLGLVHFWGDVTLFSWIFANPISFLLLGVVYFLIGTGWSLFKWTVYLRDKLEKYYDIKQEFMSKYKITGKVIPGEYQKEWLKVCDDTYSLGCSIDKIGNVSKPSPRNFKGKIFNWISYWPISVLWALTHDLFEKISKEIYKRIRGVFQKIVDKIYGEVEKDFDDLVYTVGGMDTRTPKEKRFYRTGK